MDGTFKLLTTYLLALSSRRYRDLEVEMKTRWDDILAAFPVRCRPRGSPSLCVGPSMLHGSIILAVAILSSVPNPVKVERQRVYADFMR